MHLRCNFLKGHKEVRLRYVGTWLLPRLLGWSRFKPYLRPGYFFKNGPTRPLFRLFSVFFKQTSIINLPYLHIDVSVLNWRLYYCFLKMDLILLFKCNCLKSKKVLERQSMRKKCEKCPSSILCRDSNPWPIEH